MGYDAVRGPNTYGSGCMPGAARQFEWWREQYQAGSLGCYNPASLGGMSLHAEGRAMDIALNANDPAQRARGDAIFDRVMANPDQFGAQEMLFRGYLWSYQRRSEGKRGPGIQQADHMNHVHLGIDVNAARNWQPSWVTDGQTSEDDLPYSEADVTRLVEWGVNNALKTNPEVKKNMVELASWGVNEAWKEPATRMGFTRIMLDALKSAEGQKILKDALK